MVNLLQQNLFTVSINQAFILIRSTVEMCSGLGVVESSKPIIIAEIKFMVSSSLRSSHRSIRK